MLVKDIVVVAHRGGLAAQKLEARIQSKPRTQSTLFMFQLNLSGLRLMIPLMAVEVAILLLIVISNILFEANQWIWVCEVRLSVHV